jgi:hypothetical protein
MVVSMFRSAHSVAKAKLPTCSSKDGVLAAIQLMAERHVRKILVLDDSESVIGAFQFEDNRLRYVPIES